MNIMNEEWYDIEDDEKEGKTTYLMSSESLDDPKNQSYNSGSSISSYSTDYTDSLSSFESDIYYNGEKKNETSHINETSSEYRRKINADTLDVSTVQVSKQHDKILSHNVIMKHENKNNLNVLSSVTPSELKNTTTEEILETKESNKDIERVKMKELDNVIANVISCCKNGIDDIDIRKLKSLIHQETCVSGNLIADKIFKMKFQDCQNKKMSSSKSLKSTFHQVKVIIEVGIANIKRKMCCKRDQTNTMI